jgi:hypothetical protein
VACLATLVVVALLGAAVSLRRSAAQLRVLTEELSEHAAVVMGEAEATLTRARRELDRVDDLVGSAEAITETVGSATRLAHNALAAPLIKVMAFRAGTARAGKRLRKAG